MHQTFAHDLETVLTHGGTAPDELRTLRDRGDIYTDFTDQPFTTRFAEAVVTGADEEKILHLRALALIEQAATPVDQAAVTNAAKAYISRTVDGLYETVAEENWDTIAATFNQAADAFTTAYVTVAATTDPATLVTATERTRKAWAEGQTQRTVLEGLVSALLAAARLSGLPAAQKTWSIGATINAEGLHRRRVWEAWDAEDRWTALLELGATIHAPKLDELKPYREPAPIEIRHESNGIGWVPVEYDPEDTDPADALTPDALSAHLNATA